MKIKSVVAALLCSTTLLGVAGTTAMAKEWRAKTPDQILIKQGDTTYTVETGDTMWAISQKLNITVSKLAELNNIVNPELIYPGTKISFDGSQVTIKKGNGLSNTVTVTRNDKVDPTKAVGQSVTTESSKAGSAQGNETSSSTIQSSHSTSESISSGSTSSTSEISTSTSDPGSSETSTTSSQESTPAPVPTPSQTGIEGIIAKSPTAQVTNQIVAVVAAGTSAQVYLFDKESSGNWNKSMITNGYVGSQGVGQASEDVSRTPKGSYSLGFAFGTGDSHGTQLEYRTITPNSYWISNVNDPQYNTWQERSSSSAADEHLASYPQQYEMAVTMNYNAGVGGGSGFFLHVANGRPTAGCVSVPREKMVYLMQNLHSGAYIVNVNNESELANY